jgi:hypothetical protein
VDDLSVAVIKMLVLIQHIYHDGEAHQQARHREWQRCAKKMSNLIESRSQTEGSRRLTREWECVNINFIAWIHGCITLHVLYPIESEIPFPSTDVIPPLALWQGLVVSKDCCFWRHPQLALLCRGSNCLAASEFRNLPRTPGPIEPMTLGQRKASFVRMVSAMTPQGARLMAHLQRPGADTFHSDLVPLLDHFTASVTGNYACRFLSTVLTALDENAEQALPLVQPLLALLYSSTNDMPYAQITHALSAILSPIPFATLNDMGLSPVIAQGLLSDVPELQILALRQVRKMGQVDDATVSSLIDCLGVSHAAVGKEAVGVITAVCPPQVL